MILWKVSKEQKLINEKVPEGLKRNDPKTPKSYQRYIKKVVNSELSCHKYFKICRLPPLTYS